MLMFILFLSSMSLVSAGPLHENKREAEGTDGLGLEPTYSTDTYSTDTYSTDTYSTDTYSTDTYSTDTYSTTAV